jgi:hypothetical protein
MAKKLQPKGLYVMHHYLRGTNLHSSVRLRPASIFEGLPNT